MSKLSFVSGISEKDGLIFLSSATTEIFQLCVWTRSSCRWLIRAEQNESENIGRSWSHSSSKELNYPSSGGVVSWSDSYRTSHTVCAFGWKLFVVVWHFRFASRVSLSFYLNVHVFIDSLRGKSLKSMQQTKWWLVEAFWSFWTLFLSVVNTDPERQDFKEQKHLVTQQHLSDCNSYSSLWERKVKDICVLILTNRRCTLLDFTGKHENREYFADMIQFPWTVFWQDLRNYQYSLSVVEGLRIHMEMGHSYIDIPKGSFNEVRRL